MFHLYSNDSHPGYDLHYLISSLTMYYVVFFLIAYDLNFYYLCIYIAFRLDVCKYLSTQIGNAKYVNRQADLILNIMSLHQESCKYGLLNSIIKAYTTFFFLTFSVISRIYAEYYEWS